MLIFSCVAAATHVSSIEKKKISRTAALISVISYIRNQIELYASPIEKILMSCRKELLSELGVENDPTSLSELFEESDKECERILSDFERSFGKGYRSDQVKLCDSTVSELERVKRALEESYPSKKRTAFALSLALGGTLLIALL